MTLEILSRLKNNRTYRLIWRRVNAMWYPAGIDHLPRFDDELPVTGNGKYMRDYMKTKNPLWVLGQDYIIYEVTVENDREVLVPVR